MCPNCKAEMSIEEQHVAPCGACGSDGHAECQHADVVDVSHLRVLRGQRGVAAATQVLLTGVANVDGVLLDAYTASAIVQVHDALSPQNAACFAEFPVVRAADMAWKLIARSKK